MRNGFTYKGRHSSEFGITAKTKSRPVLPEMKYNSFESPIMDGVYDFSKSNEYGHAFYNDRFFEIQIQAAAENLRALEKKISKIAVWLKGSGELCFDSLPLISWKGKFVSELGFCPELKGKTTVMTAVFRVEPFSECIFGTLKGSILDLKAELDSNIPIDVPQLFTWSFTGGNNQYVSVSKTLRVVNAGNVEARPIIRIDGQVKNVSLTCGNKSLIINDSGNDFIIDCKKFVITNSEGISVMNKVTGDFPELRTGACNIGLSMSVINTAEVRVIYTPRFVYDCDFDDVKWGESNA